MAFNLFDVTRPDLNTPPPGNLLSKIYRHPYYSQFMDPANGLNRQPPYIYRPIAPLVARGIGRLFFNDDINRGFYALTLFGLAGASVLMGFTVFLLSGSVTAAASASVVFSGIKVMKFSVYDYMLTDPLAFFLIALGVLFILQRKHRAFLLTCLLCAFTKEVGLLLLPCYLLCDFLESRTFNWRVATWGAAIIGLLLLFRASIHIPVNTYSLATTFTGRIGLANVVPAFLSVFAILTWFSLTRAVFSPFALGLLPLVLGAVLTCFFALDFERMVVYAFPFVLIVVFGVRVENPVTRLLAIAFPVVLFFLLVLGPTSFYERSIVMSRIEVAVAVLIEGVLVFKMLAERRVVSTDIPASRECLGVEIAEGRQRSDL